MWNGKRIEAFEVSKPHGMEEEIRRAATNRELKCIDPNCENPELGYRHGAKRGAYFYHFCNSNCGYTHFEKSDKPIIRAVRLALLDHFKCKGYNVEQEYRLPYGGLFCHLMFNINNKKIVLQIADDKTRMNEREKLSKACKENNCELKWIVVGEPNSYQDEYENYQTHRYLLNNSKNSDLLIINEKATEVSQTKIFKHSLFTERESNYRLTAPLDRLIFVDGEISIADFYISFNKWIENKVAEKERQKREEKEWLQRQREVSMKRMRAFEESARRMTAATTVKSPINLRRPFTNENNAPKVEEQSYPQIDLSKYVVGARVHHDRYGDGIISTLFIGLQKVHIIFDNGYEDDFTIKNLARSSTFRFIE